MAIGSNIPNYLAMANQADTAGLQQTKGMIGAAQQGINIGSKLHDRFQEQAAQEAFQKAWMSNDPNAMQQVIAQFPKFGQQMLQMIGIRDDQHRQAVGSMGVRVAGLLENGDVQGAQDVIRQNANLFDPTGEGSADSIINDIGKGATDPKKLDQWKNRMQKLTLSTLSPREIMNWGTQQQRLTLDALREQETEQRDRLMHEDRIRGQNMASQRGEMMLNRPTALMQNWEFIQNLPPDQREAAMKMLPGAAGKGGKISAGDFNPLSLTAPADASSILQGATSEQMKNAGAAHRIERNLSTVAGLLNSGKVSPQRAGTITKALGIGSAGSLAMTPGEQLYANAIKEIVTAVARKESGAAISASEWQDSYDRYLPVVGDSAALANQKYNQLRGLMKEYETSSGGIYPAFKYLDEQGSDGASPSLPAIPSDVPDDVQDILNKYPKWGRGK
ncbi:TPA: hypothetical protein ACNVDX_003640 [Citrobacter gillenii]